MASWQMKILDFQPNGTRSNCSLLLSIVAMGRIPSEKTQIVSFRLQLFDNRNSIFRQLAGHHEMQTLRLAVHQTMMQCLLAPMRQSTTATVWIHNPTTTTWPEAVDPLATIGHLNDCDYQNTTKRCQSYGERFDRQCEKFQSDADLIGNAAYLGALSWH